MKTRQGSPKEDCNSFISKSFFANSFDVTSYRFIKENVLKIDVRPVTIKSKVQLKITQDSSRLYEEPKKIIRSTYFDFFYLLTEKDQQKIIS